MQVTIEDMTLNKKICTCFVSRLTQLLVAIMLVSTGVPVSAQAETQLALNPPDGRVAIGGVITITIEVKNGSDVNAYDLTVKYNSEVITLESWGHGEYLNNVAEVKRVQEPGSFRLAVTQLASSGASGDGSLLNLTFRAKTSGTAQVFISEAKLVTSTNEMVYPGLVPGTISVTEAILPSASATLIPTGTSAPTSTIPFTITPPATRTNTSIPVLTRKPTRTRTPIPAIVVTSISTPGTAMAVTPGKLGVPATTPTQNTIPTIDGSGGVIGMNVTPGSTPSQGVLDQDPASDGEIEKLSTGRDSSADSLVESLYYWVKKIRIENVLMWGLSLQILAILSGLVVLFVSTWKKS